MTTVAMPKRSFGSLSGLNPSTLKTLRSIPLTNSPIPEESFVKEKHPGESPTSAQEQSTLSSTGISPQKDSCNMSMTFQNTSPSVLSSQSTPRTSTNILEGLDGKKMRRFGTFAGEMKKQSYNGSTTSMNLNPSSGSANKAHTNVKFIDKGDWVDSKQCHICVRDFKKMTGVFEHHCRACGQAVCGECSAKKINDNRVCDLCYLKTKNARGERRRDDQLRSKAATMKTYKKQLLKEKEELDQLFQKKFELGKKIEEDKQEHTRAITGLQKERDKAAEILMKKKETNVKLKETLAIDKSFLKEKEMELDEFKNKINALKVQIGQKRNNLDSKREELARLFRQVKVYEESPSFINMVNDMNPRDNSGSIVNIGDVSTSSIDFGKSTKPNSQTKI